MVTDNTLVNNTGLTDQVSRISWGAIIAGAITALAVSTMLNFLGLGVGFSAIDPLSEANTLEGLGTGTVIWWGISSLIALFVGGYIAGRLAGFTSNQDGAIHGFLSWALFVFITFALIAGTATSAISGISGAIGSAFGGGSSNIVVDMKNMQDNSDNEADMNLNRMRDKVYNVVSQAEQLNILSAGSAQKIREVGQPLEGVNREAVRDLEIDNTVKDFFQKIDFNINNEGNLEISTQGDLIDEQGLKEYLADNSELSEREINNVIQNWETSIENGIDEAEALYADARQKAIEVADKSAEVAAKVALSAFIILLLGAIISAVGGGLGSPRHTVSSYKS